MEALLSHRSHFSSTMPQERTKHTQSLARTLASHLHRNTPTSLCHPPGTRLPGISTISLDSIHIHEIEDQRLNSPQSGGQEGPKSSPLQNSSKLRACAYLRSRGVSIIS